MAKRTVEVFTAGCGFCHDTLRRVRQLACESCDVQVHDLTSEAGMAKARAYGVTRAVGRREWTARRLLPPGRRR